MSFRRWLYTQIFRLQYSKIGYFFRDILDYINRITNRDTYRLCINFLEKYKNPNRSIGSEGPYYIYKDDFVSDYEKLMKRILNVEFKVHGNVEDLIKNVCYGNWGKLWETGEESQESLDTVFESLCCDIGYCSDRFSWDRFIRINWEYQRIKSRVEKLTEG